MGVVLNKSSQEPPFRKSFASFRGPIRVAFSKIKNSYQESKIWNQTNRIQTIQYRLLFARMNGNNQNVIVICFFSLGPISGMAKCSPFWAGHGSSGYVFRASFALLSRTFRSKSLKKMSRYYLLSGLSRIFRKPFANVYISRKVPFAKTFQIYACGPRSYKTFHGFLHDSHIYIYEIILDFFIYFQLYKSWNQLCSYYLPLLCFKMVHSITSVCGKKRLRTAYTMAVGLGSTVTPWLFHSFLISTAKTIQNKR